MNPKRIAEVALAHGLELTPQLLGFAHDLADEIETAQRKDMWELALKLEQLSEAGGPKFEGLDPELDAIRGGIRVAYHKQKAEATAKKPANPLKVVTFQRDTMEARIKKQKADKPDDSQ